MGELSVAFVEDDETGADGSAAAGLAAGAGELVCAPDKDNMLSNAAPAKLNRFKELAIIMIGNAGSADCLKQEADHPKYDFLPRWKCFVAPAFGSVASGRSGRARPWA
jgi:hypothetical protein